MTVYSFDYNAVYDPPAPVIEITLRKSVPARTEVTLSALVDSGADATMIPITALQRIEARYVETRQMRGVVGSLYPVDLFLIAIQIGPYTFPKIHAIAAAPDGEAIIGRDLLNQLVITLNGLASVTEVNA